MTILSAAYDVYYINANSNRIVTNSLGRENTKIRRIRKILINQNYVKLSQIATYYIFKTLMHVRGRMNE